MELIKGDTQRRELLNGGIYFQFLIKINEKFGIKFATKAFSFSMNCDPTGYKTFENSFWRETI